MPDISTPATTHLEGAEFTSTAVDATSTITQDPFAEGRRSAYRIEQGIYLLFGIIEALIAIRFVLKLLGAGSDAGFAQAVYGVTAPLIAPFIGLFGTPQASGSVLEVHSLVALVVYALVGWLVIRVARLMVGESRTGVVTRTERARTHLS